MSEQADLVRTPKAPQHDLGKRSFETPPARDHQPESSNSTIAPMSAAASSAAAGDDDSHAPVQAYAKLEGPDFCYYVRTLEVLLGRHQSADDQEPVDIDLGDSKAVSRRHAKIHYNFMSQSFELQVFGKNGCLVDDEYYPRGKSVLLHHKMVIQIADIEFTFLLPKAAITPSAATTHDMPMVDLAYPLGAAMPGFAPGDPLDADALAARRGLLPPPPPGPHSIDFAAAHHRLPAHHHSHGTPPRLQSQPHPLPPPPPSGGGYPVNAITPQRLNLYSAPDASSRHLHYRPLQHPRDSAPYASQSLEDAAHDVRTPPAPLSFGDYYPSNHQQDSAGPTSGAASPRMSNSYSPHDAPLPSPSLHKQAHEVPSPSRPRPPPPNAQPAARTASSCMHILPSTQKPGTKPEAQASGDTQGELAKPVYSYASLIAQAINDTRDKKVTLNGIYTYISSNYPYYRHTQNGWQNSIRHNLSLNKAFIRVQRANNEPGKGSYWAIADSCKGQFSNGVYKRTRRTKAAMEMERAHQKDKPAKKPSGTTPKSKRKKLESHGSAGLQAGDGSEDDDDDAAGHTSMSNRRSQSYTPDRITGEKRPSPDNDDFDDASDSVDEGRDSASRGMTPNCKPDSRSLARTQNHQAHMASTGAMSTGDDETAECVSSAQSNNNESKSGSMPGSPPQHEPADAPPLQSSAPSSNQATEARLQMPNLDGDGAEERRMPKPPANAMRSRSNSTRQSAKPLSPPTRPSQPRAQKGLAR
ncbi:hypothetical protein GGI20_000511 [Coemansia sp. BCRC 34301]|nr:hypothetical protein GGI20_000511 [Coemansia sp. BCRC 34301]